MTVWWRPFAILPLSIVRNAVIVNYLQTFSLIIQARYQTTARTANAMYSVNANWKGNLLYQFPRCLHSRWQRWRCVIAYNLNAMLPQYTVRENELFCTQKMTIKNQRWNDLLQFFVQWPHLFLSKHQVWVKATLNFSTVIAYMPRSVPTKFRDWYQNRYSGQKIWGKFHHPINSKMCYHLNSCIAIVGCN